MTTATMKRINVTTERNWFLKKSEFTEYVNKTLYSISSGYLSIIDTSKSIQTFTKIIIGEKVTKKIPKPNSLPMNIHKGNSDLTHSGCFEILYKRHIIKYNLN